MDLAGSGSQHEIHLAETHEMIVRKLRLQRGWSQDHLAELTGLNVRTIQRIERGQSPSLESQKALASVFEVDVSTFQPGAPTMTQDLEPARATIEDDEREAMAYVKGLIGFYSHLASFVILMLIAGIAVGFNNPIFLWVAGGWGVGVICHGLNAYELLKPFSVRLEKRLIEKRLGRRL
ncbi:MAG: helix-turn-helix domain-containing protein [Pseudomonadota bacterium]